MATSSLTNFTVPLSTSQSASTQGLLMPKLKFRFRATFIGLGITQPSTELTKQVVSFKRPTLEFEEILMPIYNSKVYLAGKPTWTAVTCQLRDDAQGEVSKRVGEQMQKQFDFFEQSSAVSGSDYKFTTHFEVLDGGNGTSTPNVLETWELYGCYLSTADYGEANYGTNEPMTIDLTIRYDNALQTPIGAGVGSTVTRTLGITTD
jgi:hypothetical protein